jgi:purine nucleosidase
LKKIIILDCDPGHDDAVAIMLAAASEELKILGITCVGGNATLNNTKNNTLKICSLIKREDIKIFAGCNKPLVYDLVTAAHVHGKSGLDIEGKQIDISNNFKIVNQHAVDFIIESCIKYKKKIILCATGPLTNIALAILKEPLIKNYIQEIVFMGGSAMNLGNITPVAEFNIFVDPHAANIVLNSGIPLVMLGLDVTHKINVDDRIISSFLETNNITSIFFADLMGFYSKFHRKLYNSNSSPLHDPCVIAYLLDSSIFQGKMVNVIVEENSPLTRGETVVDWLGVTKRKKNCNVIVEADAKKFFKLLKHRLSLLP